MMNNNPVQITRKQPVTRIEPFDTGETIDLSEKEVRLLSMLADLFEYPAARPSISILDHFDSSDPGTDALIEFDANAAVLTLSELQELYTRTFDLNPVCSLDVGYHLFGEDYKRGEFLAKLRESQNDYELGQEAQLPDYLPVLLRMLGQMEDRELRASLVGYCLLPALKRMSGPLAKETNLYAHLFSFLTDYLEHIARLSLVEDPEKARYQYV